MVAAHQRVCRGDHHCDYITMRLAGRLGLKGSLTLTRSRCHKRALTAPAEDRVTGAAVLGVA
jgi:hypothetical protein